MYSNTTLLSICQCFDSNTNKIKENSNNNLCLLKFNNNNNEMETRRHYPDKTRRDVNFNHNIKQKQSFGKSIFYYRNYFFRKNFVKFSLS